MFGHSFEAPVHHHMALFCAIGKAEHCDREGMTSTELLTSGNQGEKLAGAGAGAGIDSTFTCMLPKADLPSLG